MMALGKKWHGTVTGLFYGINLMRIIKPSNILFLFEFLNTSLGFSGNKPSDTLPSVIT